MSDRPEGIIKTKKYYNTCDNAYWLHGYDVAGNQHSGNCKFKLADHIDLHIGDNPEQVLVRRTNNSQSEPDGVGGCNWTVK